ncbi:MAG TPA: lipid-A-disaccharide synthase, partial [Rhodanobacteraceae bacterium]|nr:lipid-A-disaccharide synthase [Rhodanobacteraceae bacterium]
MEIRTGSRVFAMVAGEDSGDLLGAELIEALRIRHPGAKFVGVGGPRMRAAGLDAWHDIAELSVMGLAEVLRHLPRLMRLRASLARRLVALQPDAFIGIDAPDFNFGLERKLKRAGIATVHYVSPSIWAWRETRAEKIGQSADIVLCLFPMEPPLYAKHGVQARFVGHPLADRFPLVPDRDVARRELGLPADAPVLAVLPGSRLSEIHRLGAIFMEATQRIAAEIPGLRIVVPCANARCRAALEKLLHDASCALIDGQAHRAM